MQCLLKRIVTPHQMTVVSTETEPTESTEEEYLLLKEISDIQFEVEGEIIPASKACLSCHSAVLRTMFFGDFMEKNRSVIPLPGKSAEGMKKFVRVTHLAQEVSFSNVYDILPIAHEYRCQRILVQCDRFLRTQCFSVRNLAACGQFELKKALKKFLIQASKREIKKLKEDVYFPSIPVSVREELYDRILQRKDRRIQYWHTKYEKEREQNAKTRIPLEKASERYRGRRM